MGRRKKPRFKMVLPFRLTVNDTDGRPLQLLAYTLDISAGGARLAGIRVSLNVGDTLHGQYKQAKARFRVVWVSEPGEKGDRQVGIQYLAGEKSIWVELPEEDFCDEVEVLDTAAAEPAAGLPQSAEVPSQDALGELVNTLEVVLEKLRETASLVHSAGLHAEIAEPFKTAIAHVRNTGFALQQWIELQQDSKDTSVALETANSERVRFATQLCRSCMAQDEELGPGISGEARTALIAAVRNLAQHLGLQHTGERPLQSPASPPPKQERDPVALLAGLNEQIRSSNFQVSELLNLIAERACLFTSAEGAAIAVRDEAEMVCCASVGMAPLLGVRFSASEALAGTAIQTARPVVWSDTQKEASVDAALCASLKVRSSVIVPITAGAGVVGALQAFSAVPDAFDDTSVLLLERLAEFVASVASGLPSVVNSAD